MFICCSGPLCPSCVSPSFFPLPPLPFVSLFYPSYNANNSTFRWPSLSPPSCRFSFTSFFFTLEVSPSFFLLRLPCLQLPSSCSRVLGVLFSFCSSSSISSSSSSSVFILRFVFYFVVFGVSLLFLVSFFSFISYYCLFLGLGFY